MSTYIGQHHNTFMNMSIAIVLQNTIHYKIDEYIYIERERME